MANPALRLVKEPAAEYVTVPRCPDELLAADLPDWQKMLWLAVRKRQGANEWAWASKKDYGEMVGKSKHQTYRGIKDLIARGWLEEDEEGRLRCFVGQDEPLEVKDEVGDEESPEGDEESPPPGDEGLPEGDEESPASYKGINPNKNPDTARDRSGESFEDFWDRYGKKVDRKKAERRWRNLTRAQREAALDGVDAYVASTPELRYRKNPLTWLNGECWNDAIIPPEPDAGPPLDLTRPVGFEDRDRAMRRHGLAESDFYGKGLDWKGDPQFMLRPEKRAELNLETA